jgi:two-component system chemotaxis response regulator CheB
MQGPVVRVLIVDDSALVRSLIAGALANEPQIQVVGQAVDGRDALRKIASLQPDVVTLDVEMPNLNGLGVLQRAAGKVPVSFLMVSTLTQSGAHVTFEALNMGAFDYVTKPQMASKVAKPEFQRTLVQKILAGARARGKVRQLVKRTGPSGTAPTLPPNRIVGWVVGIGISCGGPQTLHQMLPSFPSDFVPIVLTQHMPAQFTGPFAKHLDTACAMRVREARDGDRLEQGTIYVAPGDRHLKVVRRGTLLTLQLDTGPLVSGHRPSVDVMFHSLARACASRTVGVVMTGMGRDGADGLAALRRAGGRTIAQDEASSLVFGMPKVAADSGAAQQVVSLGQIPQAIHRQIGGALVGAGRA